MDAPLELISLKREEGGWIWSINIPDLIEHRMRLLQSVRAFATYEEACGEAEIALEEMREGR